MCTVLLRFAPGTRWPVLVGAVRDEFMARPWDWPAAHWGGTVVGGRDQQAGGTWLAVDPPAKRLGALLNGALPLPRDGSRPSRGELPLLSVREEFTPPDFRAYDTLHLIRATLTSVDVWSWDGTTVTSSALAPGDYVIVNDGVDAASDPLVAWIRPLLAGAASPDPRPGLSTVEAWGDWLPLMTGGGLDPADPRALIIRHEFGGRVYGSTSETLVALGEDGVRYDFTDKPGRIDGWREILPPPA